MIWKLNQKVSVEFQSTCSISSIGFPTAEKGASRRAIFRRLDGGKGSIYDKKKRKHKGEHSPAYPLPSPTPSHPKSLNMATLPLPTGNCMGQKQRFTRHVYHAVFDVPAP